MNQNNIDIIHEVAKLIVIKLKNMPLIVSSDIQFYSSENEYGITLNIQKKKELSKYYLNKYLPVELLSIIHIANVDKIYIKEHTDRIEFKTFDESRYFDDKLILDEILQIFHHELNWKKK